MRKIDILNKNYEKIGLDTIVYTNKTIDEVCYIDSDGTQYTYRDIFETANDVDNPFIENGTTDWSSANSSNTEVNEILLNTGNGGSAAPYAFNSGVVSNNGETFYARTRARITNALSTSISLRLGSSQSDEVKGQALPTINIWYELSGILTKTSDDLSLVIYHIYESNADATGAVLEIDYALAINLAIFTSVPSESKLDEWFTTYLARKDITKTTYTLREFMALNLIDNPFMENGIEDWLAQGGNTIEVVDGILEYTFDTVLQVVGTEYLRTLSNVITVIDEIFYSFDLKSEKESYNRLYIGSEFPYIGDYKTEWENYSGIRESVASSPFGWMTNADVNMVLNDKIYIDSVIIIKTKQFDENMTQENLDYIVALYKKVKYEEEDSDTTYSKTGISKFDIAYTNKSVDEVVYEGKTLRDIFEHGNYLTYVAGWQYQIANIVFDDLSVSFENTTLGVAGLGIDPDLPADENTWYLGLNVNGKIGDSVATSLGNAYTYSLVLTEKNQLLSRIISGVKGNRTEIEVQYSLPSELNLTIEFKDIIFVNMNMFIVEPSQTQMDTWRDMYLARRNLTKIELTYSDIFEKSNLINNPFMETSEDIWSIGSGAIDTLENEKLKVTTTDWGYFYHTYPHIKDDRYYLALAYMFDNVVVQGGRVTLDVNNYFTVENTQVMTDYSGFLQSDREDGNTDLLIYPSYGGAGAAYYDYIFMINTSIFDERITQTQLDIMLATYKAIRNVIIVSEVFLITEPIGFGKRYKMLTIGDHVYGHELDFEEMGFKVNFGINYNAYDGYNLLITFLKDNEAIIEYDWGKGSRFADVRLLAAPKTEKDTLSLIISKFAWQLLNPFYELIEFDTLNPTIKNTHNQDITPLMEFVTSSNSVQIELINQDTLAVDFDIRINTAGLSFPATIILDSENNTIKLEDGTNIYDRIDKAYNTFLSIPYDVEYVVSLTNITTMKWTHKQWVVD